MDSVKGNTGPQTRLDPEKVRNNLAKINRGEFRTLPDGTKELTPTRTEFTKDDFAADIEIAKQAAHNSNARRELTLHSRPFGEGIDAELLVDDDPGASNPKRIKFSLNSDDIKEVAAEAHGLLDHVTVVAGHVAQTFMVVANVTDQLLQRYPTARFITEAVALRLLTRGR